MGRGDLNEVFCHFRESCLARVEAELPQVTPRPDVDGTQLTQSLEVTLGQFKAADATLDEVIQGHIAERERSARCVAALEVTALANSSLQANNLVPH